MWYNSMEGKIDKIVEIMRRNLENLSNRDYVKFDEKAVNDKLYLEEVK